MAITYPIQETDKFTVYDTNTSAPLKDGAGRPMTGVKWGSNDLTQMIPNLADNIKWLIEVVGTRPTFDPLTQKIKRLPVSYDVANETATTQSFEVVDLTQEEIDAKLPPHFLSPTTTIKYDVAIESQNAFTRMLTLVNETQMPSDQALVVKDVLGASIGITVEQFHADMILYGLHCYELFNYVPPAVDPDGMI
jgi:hypothetical protein